MLQNDIKSPDSISYGPPKHYYYGWDPDPVEIEDKISTDSLGATITGFYLTIKFYFICSRYESLQIGLNGRKKLVFLIERGLTIHCLILHDL